MDLVEIFLVDVFDALAEKTRQVALLLGTPVPEFSFPLPRVTYRESLKILKDMDCHIEFGQNIHQRAELLLTEHFKCPVWITHKPRVLEPFPYSICESDDSLTMTADLISSGGFGEICGVAEKSFEEADLAARLAEVSRPREVQEAYQWVLQSRGFGMVPHTAFGMGFERVLRWFCGAPHVRDVIPFPRTFGRDFIP